MPEDDANIVFDSRGNRRFRVRVDNDIASVIDLRAADERGAAAHIVANSIGVWVVRGCPSPIRPSDFPREAHSAAGLPVYIYPPRSTHRTQKAYTIWLHHTIHVPAIEAMARYQRVMPEGFNRGCAFPPTWLTRIVKANVNDDWSDFNASSETQAAHENPGRDESGPRQHEPGAG